MRNYFLLKENPQTFAILIGDQRLKTKSQIRLAHVYQWQQDYRISEKLFTEAIASCQQNPHLKCYLDFAYQHMGKCKFDRQLYEEARYYFEQALSLRLIKGDRSLIDSTRLALEHRFSNRKLGSA
ncbi:MAG: tetratricopeptide repeat protein [Xenococcaceae cyanobacterium MO_188.B29]|nr:tetratricopeptide repeat protein [Xenococcaceae cyanobacterium MO_188.B29]